MSSKIGRKYANWSTPEGWLLKGIIHTHYKAGHRDTLGEKLRTHVSREVCVAVIGRDVTDNAILQRGHKGVFGENEFEHPDKHPMGMKMLPLAREIVRNKRRLTLDEIKTLTQSALSVEEELPLSQVTEDETGIVGILYVVDTGGENCAFGITSKKSALERISSFAKGDIDCRMNKPRQFWMTNPRVVESAMKSKFKDEHQGNERYAVPASTIVHFAKTYCNRFQVAHYEIVS